RPRRGPHRRRERAVGDRGAGRRGGGGPARGPGEVRRLAAVPGRSPPRRRSPRRRGPPAPAGPQPPMTAGGGWPLRRRVRVLFTAAAVVAAVTFGIGVVAFQRLLDARERLVDELDPALVALDDYSHGL